MNQHFTAEEIKTITAEFVRNLNGWYDPESGLALELAVSWLTETIKIEKNESYAQGWNEGQQALKNPPDRPLNHERD